ncbi:GDSL-type esterase/lipase family protein [Massilia timonae]|uniref:GDSL-like Lipase/Acylhydrolase family protein n=1 Tax=Massilia timonae TaxID=47229 RepID=A0A1S2NDV0_9BURK|nr:GDSL-type esterase/lipase family protein [Massilia timonae]OIJ43023.1 GDSL-like Lipase/Acylhydrolase family protein [Massilia timonae]
MRAGLAAVSLSIASMLPALAHAAPPVDLVLFDGAPRQGVTISAVAPDTEHVLLGERVDAAAGIRDTFPGSAIELARGEGPGGGKALTLRWNRIWKSGVRFAGPSFDLRPYLAAGTLAFDLKVDALDQGGILFRVGCGDDCERHVSYVLPGRAAQGKGWQRIVLSMSCFARDGDDFRSVTRPFLLEGTGSGQVGVANVAFSQAGTPNTPCPDWRTVAVTPDTLNESWSTDWWLPRHRQKLEEARRMVAEGRSPQLVFIGDSITQGWEKEGAQVWQQNYARHHALALGFGGDRTENVLWRLQHGEVDGIDPKVAVLLIGTNNTGHRRDFPAITAAGIARNLEELKKRLPRTRILLLAIFPRDAKADGPLRRLNEQVNARLPALADGRQVFYLDVNKAFLAPDGSLPANVMPDWLHPNEAGYAIWARAMQPELERLLALPRL